jgi:hypothetical protein
MRSRSVNIWPTWLTTVGDLVRSDKFPRQSQVDAATMPPGGPPLDGPGDRGDTMDTYPKEAIDAKLDVLRHEFRADLTEQFASVRR